MDVSYTLRLIMHEEIFEQGLCLTVFVCLRVCHKRGGKREKERERKRFWKQVQYERKTIFLLSVFSDHLASPRGTEKSMKCAWCRFAGCICARTHTHTSCLLLLRTPVFGGMCHLSMSFSPSLDSKRRFHTRRVERGYD